MVLPRIIIINSKRAWFLFPLLLLLLGCPEPTIFYNALSFRPPPPPPKLVILGLGRVGSEVARQAASLSFFSRIVGTVRPRNRTATMYDATSRPSIVSWPEDTGDDEPILAAARDCTHLLVTLPPKDDINVTLLLDRIVQELPMACCWIGILSTTGVYGHHDGNWVTEATAIAASRNADYEAEWRHRSREQVLHIFRCAGIYGGTQSALHTVYRQGIPSSSATPRNDLTNRIHVHDLAAALVASMRQHDASAPPSVHVFNLADDLPEARSVVMDYAVSLLQRMNVTLRAAAPVHSSSGRTRRREVEVKRVSNEKMKRELLCGGSLQYPTYREGLQAILRDRTNPWWQPRPDDDDR